MIALLALLGTLAVVPPQTQATAGATCPAEGPDSDGDRLTDSCELDLLKRFAPALVASPSACNWDAEAGRLGGGYLVGAEPVPGGVRLAYLPAYFEDCGWSGAKCLVRLRGGCDPHAGDSEAVFIDVAWDAAHERWMPSRVFLSAHCFGGSDGRCRWFEPGELKWFGSTVVIWVAEGKNGNYPSRASCDSGHWGFDTCDRNDRTFRFPVQSPRQDIGSAAHPFPHLAGGSGCVDGREVAGSSGRDGRECPWSDATFRGWVGGEARGATGYRRYLRQIAGFLPDAPAYDSTRR